MLSLARAPLLGKTPYERFRRAEQFSKVHKIDLASAYSILLGILPLENAPPLVDTNHASDPPTPRPGPTRRSPKEPAEGETARYDPAFRPAVAEGYLTIRQAVERGDRVRYASSLAQRHRLSMHVAFLVADNRVHLAKALENAAANPPDRSVGESGTRWIGSVLSASVALVALAVGGMWLAGDDRARGSIPHAGTQRDRPHVAAPSVQAESEVRSNPEGSITEVRGRDPSSVLAAYCRSTQGAVRPEPVRIDSTSDGHSVGVLEKDGSLLAIQIRKGDTSDAWFAGNGRDPIVPSQLANEGHTLAKGQPRRK